jgi:hypothetical protein
MTSYTVRVELHNADEGDYASLDDNGAASSTKPRKLWA